MTGRPTKFTDEIRNVMINLAKEGKTMEQIADTIGVNPSSLYLWQGKHGFSESLKEARLTTDDMVEASLFKRALGYSCEDTKFFMYEGEILKEKYTKHYPPDVVACIFWLKNRRPDDWREQPEPDGADEEFKLPDSLKKNE